MPAHQRLCVAAALAACLSASAASAEPVGRIVGHLDGVSRDGDHFFISGWACQQGQHRSIAVHVYGEDPKDPSKRALLIVQFANLHNEPAVAQACQDRDSNHRFVILLPHGYGPDSRIYVHGIRLVDGVANDAVAGSGVKLTPLPTLQTLYPPLPHLAGTYRSVAEHPRVFMTAADLKDLAARINRPGSYSMRRFGLLAEQIKRDLASGIDWDVTYAGCDGGVYQYVFSYEPQDHHDAETRAQLDIAPGHKAPAGGAVVAARLALYAVLAKAGAALPPGAPGAGAAATLAKRILLAWADRSFLRDAQGRILPLVASVCGPAGRVPTMTQPRDTGRLGLGRGVPYSVQAQDLLQFYGGVTADEERRLDALHAGLFELLRQSANAIMGSTVFPYPECARYGGNQQANGVAGLLAVARLLDDQRKFDAVLFGEDQAIPMLMPWNRLFDRSIYGFSDGVPPCFANHFPDSLISLQNHSDYQNVAVAPGEIADRNRNANPLQGIGYPMFTLERLFNAAEIMRIAGYDAYGYRGAHRQSLEMAMQYYACFGKGAGFYKVVTAENSGFCPDATQYFGKLVNGVDRMLLIGAYRFPDNKPITELEDAAKANASSSNTFATDAILFGKWRD
jgi:hypothetical protein